MQNWIQRHIYNRRFSFVFGFVPWFWLQTLQKVLIWAEFHEKKFVTKSDRKMNFLTFIAGCKSFPSKAYWGELFSFFQPIPIQHPFFDTCIEFCKNILTKKTLLTNFDGKIARNGSEKLKTCVINGPRIPVLIYIGFVRLHFVKKSKSLQSND